MLLAGEEGTKGHFSESSRNSYHTIMVMKLKGLSQHVLTCTLTEIELALGLYTSRQAGKATGASQPGLSHPTALSSLLPYRLGLAVQPGLPLSIFTNVMHWVSNYYTAHSAKDTMAKKSEEKPCLVGISIRLGKPISHQSAVKKIHVALEERMVLHEWSSGVIRDGRKDL